MLFLGGWTSVPFIKQDSYVIWEHDPTAVVGTLQFYGLPRLVYDQTNDLDPAVTVLQPFPFGFRIHQANRDGWWWTSIQGGGGNLWPSEGDNPGPPQLLTLYFMVQQTQPGAAPSSPAFELGTITLPSGPDYMSSKVTYTMQEGLNVGGGGGGVTSTYSMQFSQQINIADYLRNVEVYPAYLNANAGMLASSDLSWGANIGPPGPWQVLGLISYEPDNSFGLATDFHLEGWCEILIPNTWLAAALADPPSITFRADAVMAWGHPSIPGDNFGPYLITTTLTYQQVVVGTVQLLNTS